MTDLLPGETREPLPGLESALAAAMAGQLGMGELLRQFSRAGLIVPSITDFSNDPTAFQPLIFTPDEMPVMAVFTARDRMLPYADVANFSTVMLGRTVFEGLQPGVGLVVNPGSGLGFDIQPEGIAAIVAELTAAAVGMPDPDVALEQAILDGHAGDLEPEALLEQFLAGSVYVLSHSADGVEPYTFLREDKTFVGAFTRPEHAATFTEGVEHAAKIDVAFLAANLTEGVGIIVNPGGAFPWEVSAEVVASAKP